MLCWTDKSGKVQCNGKCLDAYDNRLTREFAVTMNEKILLTRMAPCSPLLPMFIDQYMNIRQTEIAFKKYNEMLQNIERKATEQHQSDA